MNHMQCCTMGLLATDFVINVHRRGGLFAAALYSVKHCIYSFPLIETLHLQLST